MALRNPADVAARCLGYELLVQRLALETDTEEAADAREAMRQRWLGKVTDLGVGDALFASDRALLERPVGRLTEDELDDLHDRGASALVLLWALGRLDAAPDGTVADDAPALVAERGLLGEGSLAATRAAATGAQLRGEDELRSAHDHYREVAMSDEADDAHGGVAVLGATELSWVLAP